MARRRMTKRRTPRRDKSVKLFNVAEAYVQANIVTETLMDTSPLEFALGDLGVGFASGGGISLKELATQPRLLGVVGQRAMDPNNIIGIAVKSAIANVGFKFAKRALRRPVNLMNRNVFKPLALGVKL